MVVKTLTYAQYAYHPIALKRVVPNLIGKKSGYEPKGTKIKNFLFGLFSLLNNDPVHVYPLRHGDGCSTAF